MIDTVDVVKTAIEQHPNIWLAVGIAISPFFTVGALLWATNRWLIPAWENQQKLNREHLTELLKQKSDESSKELTASRDLHKVQTDSLHERIELKIEHIDEKIKNNESLLRSIASKLGAMVLIIVLCSFFIAPNSNVHVEIKEASAYHQAFQTPLKYYPEASIDCDPSCPKGFSCCGINKCCEDSSTASSEKMQCAANICK